MTSPLTPQAASLIQESPTLSNLASITVLQPFYYLVQQTIHWLFMGYSMTAFCLFTWDKWFKVSEGLLAKMGGSLKPQAVRDSPCPLSTSVAFVSPQVYKSIYFLGHVFFLSLLFILPYVHKAMVPRKEKLKKMG